jgi:hypothetical protein
MELICENLFTKGKLFISWLILPKNRKIVNTKATIIQVLNRFLIIIFNIANNINNKATFAIKNNTILYHSISAKCI